MSAFPTVCTIALLAGAVTCQGARSGTGPRNLPPTYPVDVQMHRTAPFLDAKGKGRKIAARAVGAADFDGDRNRDLWFLGDGATTSEISVRFANSASLGRFYVRDGMATTKFVDGATYHSKSSGVDQILLVDPAKDQPTLLHWNPRSVKGDPRDGSLGGGDSGWAIGKGVTEVATAEHTGDGNDDIVALRSLPGNQTEIVKLVMDDKKFSFLWVEQTIRTVLPARLQKLRLLDIDGDGRTDFVAHATGVGVVACRDSGFGTFNVVGFWPTGGGVLSLQDLQTGDMDGNGRDDIALCFAAGIVVIDSHKIGQKHPTGYEYRVFVNPTTVGALKTCRIVDTDTNGVMLLVGFPHNGRNYVIHPQNPGIYGIVQPWVEPAPKTWTGTGVVGESVIVTDVDNDNDPDFVIQSPNGIDWMTLRNPAITFAPEVLKIESKGKATSGEGDRFNVTVTMPQGLVTEGVTKAEIAIYAVDPNSTSSKDPEYVYWGRLLRPISKASKKLTFTLFQWDQKSFDAQVKLYLAARKNGLKTSAYVFPSEANTIRIGPDSFMSIHGMADSMRFESGDAVPKPPSGSGSTLGGKWVLVAQPPSPKGDVQLLPWE